MTPGPHPGEAAFKAAVLAGEADALLATMAPGVRFNSPAVFRPYDGRDAVAPLLRAVMTVLAPTLRYVWQVQEADRSVLGFVAKVDGKDIEGIDSITWDEEGLVSELTVMVRPLSGLVALRDVIAARMTS
jgi:hypothetical protein